VTEAESKTVAQQVAEATAIAVSEVYSTCSLADGAKACAEASTFIMDTAETVAEVLPLTL
jgi:hypothetical protein